jgi:hypothetical protein
LARFLSKHSSYSDGTISEHWCVFSFCLTIFLQSINLPTNRSFFIYVDMSSTAFIEPLPVIEFVTQLLNRDVSARPVSDADRVKVSFVDLYKFI